MPLYEYKCESCAHRFERIQKFSDPPVETCPQCGGHVKKLLSSPAIQFKGSGFYITDYGSKSEKSKGSEGSEGSKESKESKGSEKAEKAEKKAESTPAPKADTGGSKSD